MAQQVRFSYTVRDALGTEASECFYGTAPDTATMNDLTGTWSALLGVLVPITSGGIVGGAISFPMSNVPVIGSDSRVEEVGVFNLNATDPVSGLPGRRRFGQEVVALKDTVIVAGKIDLTNAAVAAFWAVLAGTGGIVRFTNAYGQPLITLIDAILSFRKHKGQLQRSSIART